MTARKDPILVLKLRAEARAVLYAEGEYETLEEAMVPLFAWATTVGLERTIGAGGVHDIVRRAFASVAPQDQEQQENEAA